MLNSALMMIQFCIKMMNSSVLKMMNSVLQLPWLHQDGAYRWPPGELYMKMNFVSTYINLYENEASSIENEDVSLKEMMNWKPPGE